VPHFSGRLASPIEDPYRDAILASLKVPPADYFRRFYATALVPQRRAAHAGEVAAVITWLLSDAASYVNGAVIAVDGSATAVDVGTVPFDPRVSVRQRGDGGGNDRVGQGG